jgi:hypothetical protein
MRFRLMTTLAAVTMLAGTTAALAATSTVSASTVSAGTATSTASAGTVSAGTASAGTTRDLTARHAPAVLTISGAVTTPASYTLSQLAALPGETVTLSGPHGTRVPATGVSLDALVTAASPVLPAAKNAILRVIVTASGPGRHGLSFALGELDASFGGHDALLALSVGGHQLRAPALVVPGDAFAARDLPVVTGIRVGVTSPAVTAPPSAGSLVIQAGKRQVVLSAAQLARLPAHALTVTFLAGTAAQTHTESGPTLAAVLRAAHVRADLNTWVAAVGSDGYVATATPGEAWFGGRPLLVSLAEDGTALAAPRLVTDGDVKGGRYVSGVYDLVIGEGAPAS